MYECSVRIYYLLWYADEYALGPYYHKKMMMYIVCSLTPIRAETRHSGFDRTL